MPSYSVLENKANLNLLISFNELTTELKQLTLLSVLNGSQLDTEPVSSQKLILCSDANLFISYRYYHSLSEVVL